MVNRNIHLFLIPMPFYTFVSFEPFVLLSPAYAFLLNFIQAPLSIVSFCVRDVFNFQLMDGEELLEILYSCVSILCFDMFSSFRIFYS